MPNRRFRAVCAAAAGAAIYYGASEIGARKIKLSGLWVMSSLALAGIVAAQDTSKTRDAHARIDKLVTDVSGAKTTLVGKLDKTGGTISGALTVQGQLNCQANLDMQNHVISRADSINPADGNANVHSTGGLTIAGNIDLAGNNAVNCNAVSNGSSQVSFPAGLNASEIGPGGTRANIPSTGTLWNPDGVDRSNWLKQMLMDANISY